MKKDAFKSTVFLTDMESTVQNGDTPDTENKAAVSENGTGEEKAAFGVSFASSKSSGAPPETSAAMAVAVKPYTPVSPSENSAVKMSSVKILIILYHSPIHLPLHTPTLTNPTSPLPPPSPPPPSHSLSLPLSLSLSLSLPLSSSVSLFFSCCPTPLSPTPFLDSLMYSNIIPSTYTHVDRSLL